MSFDHASLGDAFDAPPLQHISYGIVDTSGNPPVRFDDPVGPLVAVTLQPRGLEVECRVGAHLAGNGESAYFPFIAGDEVLVAIPDGDERSGCVIIARLNNGIDTWPASVAGQDVTANTLGFQRLRTPFVIETASSWMVRAAATGAFIGISPEGQVTISNADAAFIALSPDFLGMQSGDASLQLQLDLHQKAAVLAADGSKLVVSDQAGNSWLSAQAITIAGNGSMPLEHAVSIESLVNVLASFLTLWSPLLAALGPIVSGPALAATINPAALPGLLNAAIALAAVGDVTAYTPAIASALAAKTGVPNFPSVGCPGLVIG